MNNETALAIPGKEHLHRLMGQMEVQIADVLPTYLDAARQSKLILVEASKNPDIYRCCEETPVSVTAALMLASELGLDRQDFLELNLTAIQGAFRPRAEREALAGMFEEEFSSAE